MFSLPLCCLVGEGAASSASPGGAILALGLSLCRTSQELVMVREGRELGLGERIPSPYSFPSHTVLFPPPLQPLVGRVISLWLLHCLLQCRNLCRG